MVEGLDETRRMTNNDTATYVYCALRAATRPTLRRGRRGLPASEAPRAMATGDQLWLIVSTVPLAHYGAEVIERGLGDLDWVSRCAMAHEAVVEDAARFGPVIPMKLFTLFGNDERAESHIGRTRKKLARLFDRIAGRQEWGVRVSVDERKAIKRRTGSARPAAALSGTGFLMRKKAEKDAARRVLEEALEEGERIFNELAGAATDTRRRTPVQSNTAIRVVLDAAFLVPAKEAGRFRKAVAKQAKTFSGQGYEVTLTGPWPPYNFVSESA
jgi:hypothetical protein